MDALRAKRAFEENERKFREQNKKDADTRNKNYEEMGQARKV
jgi:hypothetical protein